MKDAFSVAVDPQPGMMIGDSLRLERHLSDGGMATLWLAQHVSHGENVVVKFLSPKLANAPHVADRFRREAEITSRVWDPHIVRVYEFVDDGPAQCLVMERLKGEDLASRIARLGTLSLDETCEIIRQAASALESAHAVGIIHRDVKPENIFLTQNNGRLLIKLLDFGVAKVDELGADAIHLTGPGLSVGTPLYMSPEQLLDARTVDARCDVWSLAVVAYACLTGRAPLEGSSFASVCVGLQECDFEPPSHWRPDLPAGLDEFFARALALRIDERPASPGALSAGLRDAVLGGYASVQPERAEELAFPLVRRKRPLPDVMNVRVPSLLPAAAIMGGQGAVCALSMYGRGIGVRARQARVEVLFNGSPGPRSLAPIDEARLP
jgi:serine/threonine protein kinase